MIENGAVPIPEDKKKKLVNYFRFHDFVSFVINQIIHRNFQETQKKILEEQKNDDLLPLLPNFDFEQVFDSLVYFIENNTKNIQIKTALKFIYDNKYKLDNELGIIMDVNQEVIQNDEDGIKIKIKKEDIMEIKEYFKGVKVRNDEFVDLYNKKFGIKVLVLILCEFIYFEY